MFKQLDYFMYSQNLYDRLLEKYKQHGFLAIAYDVDDTIFNTHDRPGASYELIKTLIRRARPYSRLSVWTSAPADRHDAIKQYLAAENLPYDAFNESVFGYHDDSRKIYYHILLDDKSCGLALAHELLTRLFDSLAQAAGPLASLA